MFDLLNVNIGSNGHKQIEPSSYDRNKSIRNSINKSTGHSRSGVGSEEKAAKAFLSHIDSISFDHHAFAYLISNAGSALNKRAFTCLFALVEVWAERLEENMVADDDEMRLAVMAARMKDFLDNYGK